jgi:CheY-like chemotaxis protein
MREIAEWLITVEHSAGTLYKEAADFFRDDNKLSSFLKHLSDDEALHFHIMGSAAEYLSKTYRRSEITIDDETKGRVETPLVRIKEMLSEKSLTRDEMIGSIVDIEYSEFNDIFLYVVNILKESSYEFSYGVSKIQQHMDFIEHFMNSTPETQKHLDEFAKLPSVWGKRILIVDNKLHIIYLLKATFKKEGNIDIALNGKEALEKASKQYFDLIITDIKMPVMNGIEFFQQLAEKDTKIADNFIFFSRDLTKEHERFIKKNNLRILIKPSSIKEIRQAAREVLNRTP